MKKISSILFVLFVLAQAGYALTVKDLVDLKGDQENEITGVGLVVGLAGTGDKKNPERDKMVKAWLANAGLVVSEEALDAKAVALVNITGRLKPHMTEGQKIPLTVSVLSNAKSLRGGILLFTKLYYAGNTDKEKQIYATAQGPLQFDQNTGDSVANVSGIVQSSVPNDIVVDGIVRLQLKKPGYNDAAMIARQINQYFMKYEKRDISKAVTAGVINVDLPKRFVGNHVNFIAEMNRVPILFIGTSPKIRINSKTNMVTFNERVEVSPFAFIYKDMHIKVLPPDAEPDNKARNQMHMMEKEDTSKTDLQNFMNAINQIRGISAQDLAEIVKEAHKIGAIHGELIIE
jgi:flagellar P-ring protein FlgI